MSSILFNLLALSSIASAAPSVSRVLPRAPPNASPPLATTVNGTYYGTHSSTYNQDFFLGIPFAQPPVNDLRFKNPQSWNASWDGASPATNYASECVGYGGDQVGYEQTEDCLYLNVVRPSGYENVRLPVAVWIHGGGFFMGGAVDRRYNLSFLVENSVAIGKPIMAASMAYRLGPFGFLNGDAVAKEGATNLGLKDQRLGLQWIHENIAGFGGDPTKVTIWGESAGAASVGFHLVAFNGRDDKLFRAAVMESGNPIAFGSLHGTETYQAQYNSLVATAGCSNSANSLQCLRELPFVILNKILNTTEFNNNWGPALDGDFIARLGSEQFADGSFVHVPIIDGANSDEGQSFSPTGVDTVDDFIALLNSTSSRQPALPANFIQKLAKIYFGNPDYVIPSNKTLHGDTTLGQPWGAEYRHSAAFFGDQVFIAARRLTCETWAAANVPAYCYRFNALQVGTPWPIGVTHFQEVAYVFNNLEGVGYAYDPFAHQPESFIQLSNLMSKTWASFVHDLDPNGWTGRDAAVPAWPAYHLKHPQNMVWDANVTSHTESDTFRAKGIKLLNENWKLFMR